MRTFPLVYHLKSILQGNNSILSCYRLPSRSYHKQTSNATVFEIHNGVGGSEAMLFAIEMFEMYKRYFLSMGWPHDVTDYDLSEVGGIRSAKLIVNSPFAFEALIQEAGVHRVQRIPKTEKHGRMHTSTVTVAVTPKSVLEFELRESDLEQQTKRATGPGGQFVNKTESAVRLIHKPTGIAVESQESRHQLENRKTARKKLHAKIQQIELDKITSKSEKLRKSQLGNADRNEKIRTYNFPQDRITDHRLNKSYHNLRGLMAGDISILRKIIEDYQNLL